jgi:uncharacterized protein (TIGR04222 family)
MQATLLLLLSQIVNLLNLDSVNFLSLYLPIASLCVLAAFVFRWWPRQVNNPDISSTLLNEYEIAYLAGGRSRARDLAVINLVRRGYLHVSPNTGRVEVAKTLLNYSHPLEQAVAQNPSNALCNTSVVVKEVLDLLHQHLQYLGLVFEESQSGLAVRWFSTFPVFGMVLLGFCKIVVDVIENQPVGFTVVICGAIAVTGCFLLLTPHQTQQGNHLLHELQERYASLKHVEMLNDLTPTQSKKFANLSASKKSKQVGLAFALFGKEVLAAKPYRVVQPIFNPPRPAILNSRNYDGAATSSWGDGGDDCGDGGCGGD